MHNYSFHAMIPAWIICVAPHLIAVALFDTNKAKGTPKWDNSNPRHQFSEERFKVAKISPRLQGMIVRAEGAQTNSWEQLSVLGVAIVAANLAKLPVSTIHNYIAFYLLSRIAYIISYIYIDNGNVASIRTLLFFSGVIPMLRLLVKSGNALSAKLV